MRTQMTVSPRARAGALVDDAKAWQSIDWKATRRQVRRLQMRIAKAVKEGKPGKVKSLQWLLTHSHHAKLLAVKRVTSNEQLWRMLRRRHPKRTKKWLVPRYWVAAGRKWIFAVKSKYKGKTRVYQVLKVSSIGIKRHIKVRADANPYMPQDARYFWQRKHKKEARLLGALSARQLRAQVA